MDRIRIETKLKVETVAPSLVSAQSSRKGEISGGQTSIECSATGVPAPNLVFKFREDEYSGRIVSRTRNLTAAVLDIHNLSQENEGEYTCLAVNEYGNSQAVSYLDVFSRTIILSGPSDTVLRSGESTSIPCKVNTSHTR